MRQFYATQLAIVTGAIIILVAAAFALIQSPEILSAPVRPAIANPHHIKGREQCDACHGYKGMRPYPLKHLGWSNESCTKCHLRAPR